MWSFDVFYISLKKSVELMVQLPVISDTTTPCDSHFMQIKNVDDYSSKASNIYSECVICCTLKIHSLSYKIISGYDIKGMV